MHREYQKLINMYMQDVINDSMELLIFFDQDGMIIGSNSMALKELRYNALEGIRMADVFPLIIKDTEDGKAELEKMGSVYTDATVAYRSNQTCFPVNIKITQTREQGEYFGICAAMSTAAEKEALKNATKAKKEVARANTFRNDFMANVTHELRTPVNGILGHAKNLMTTSLDHEQRHTVEIIESCCDNMIEIINNLLDYSKLQAGRFTIEEKEFNFHHLIEQVCDIHINAINDKGLRLVANVAKDIPEKLIGDELCIKQILNNLISNAIKFTMVGRIAIQVTKTMQKENDIELFFMVMDTGIGIDPEKKDMLFQSFYQADASITRRFGGTGLGLSICKELVELMGGTISIESIKDKGSTFSFTIRLKLTQEDAGRREQQPEETISLSEYTLPSFPMPELEDESSLDALFEFGTRENLEEIQNTMEKLHICIDMGTWEKAENFAGVVKRLVENGDHSLKRLALRLEMTIRKEDREKSMVQFHNLETAINEFL